jgi:hypothetical protein
MQVEPDTAAVQAASDRLRRIQADLARLKATPPPLVSQTLRQAQRERDPFLRPIPLPPVDGSVVPGGAQRSDNDQGAGTGNSSGDALPRNRRG